MAVKFEVRVELLIEKNIFSRENHNKDASIENGAAIEDIKSKECGRFRIILPQVC